jgi:murein DD-endopeptidase MepM/ murein hydrolase activator NlpD
MVTRWRALVQRCFPERQFLLRSGDKVRYLSLPGWAQVSALATGLAVLTGVGGLAGAYHHLHKAVHRMDAEVIEATNRAAALATLQDAIAHTDAQYAQMSEQLDDVTQLLDVANADNETMRTEIAGAEARVATLDKTRLALERRLHGAEATLASKSGNVTQLSKQLALSRTELRDAEQARTGLQTKLQQLLAASNSATSRTGQLKESLAMREQELKQIATERDRLRSQFDEQTAKAPPGGYGSELEQLIASTGVDLEHLLGPLDSVPAGQGGPFVALDPDRATPAQERAREAALQSLAQSLPLAAPLEHYQLESPFGPRVDPINHREGFHTGLDLSSPYRSPVLSTAPGTVTFTGVKDDYGRVVEITHAHGIVTRYAHLHRILVAPGQKVKVHQVIAELGSTGRSTGPHVHYEVLVNGVQVDPAKFMEAGKSVTLIGAKN